MMNPFQDVNWNPSFTERRKFASSLVVGCPALAAIFSLVLCLGRHTWKPGFLWLAAIGFLLGAILWLLPSIARPFYVVWYFIACCLGFLFGNFLLLAFYYLILTPIGLMVRGMGMLSLEKAPNHSASSYWRDAEKTVAPERYYRQF